MRASDLIRFICRSLAAIACATALSTHSSQAEILPDIEYARVEGRPLLLDLYRANPPCEGLVVYVHGGGWSGGSKEDCPIRSLTNSGFSVASIEYRLTTQTPFPANIHDIKAALRFLRAEARRFGYPADRIAIAGSSAGGHLAALAGLSSGHQALDGNEGDHLSTATSVRAIVSFFGASNLQTILSQSTEHGLQMRVPALQRLLGGLPTEKPELARLASPTSHLDSNDPPILLIHGDADPQMPYQQSVDLEAAAKAAGVNATLHTIPGGKHGGSQFYDETRMALVVSFLKSSFLPPPH